VSEAEAFASLIRRVRSGDAQTAADLVRQYEPEIRRKVRIWLRFRDARLRRSFDSMDICQSVLADFFVRTAAGAYDLEKPEQLLRLLLGIAQNKLAFQVRKLHQQARDVRRERPLSDEGAPPLAAGGPTPSRMVAGKELLEEFRRRLSEDERRLTDLRAQGLDWSAIAAEVGGTAESRRKQLARAVERVSQELGLGEE
jgi:DNA-directed RNA polymerase specialized sigma24 family protein